MIKYTIMLLPDAFADKFEGFISNLNRVNSKKLIEILKKEEVVAVPNDGKRL